MTKHDDYTNKADESAEMYDSFKIMSCICPVCGEKTEVDFSIIPPNGLETNCTSCNAPLLIRKSTFAQKEKNRVKNANCASCGNMLKDHQQCDSCGAVFPDYYEALKSDRKQPGPVSTKFSSASIALIIVLLLITAGLYFYNYLQMRDQYIDNYFKALHAIKSGIDLNLKVSLNQPVTTRINSTDEAKINRIRTESARRLKEIGKPPVGLKQANEKLVSLYKVYLETDALITSPPKTSKDLSDLIDKLTKNSADSEKELKASFPDSLKTGLENARLKYKGLKDF